MINSDPWYYLPPYVRTTITKMLEFGFTYDGNEEYQDWGYWGDFEVEGWSLEIDEGDYFDDDAIPHLDAIWIETGDCFSIELSQIDQTLAFIGSICEISGDELSFEQVYLALSTVADLIRSWQRSHYDCPGQLELFSNYNWTSR